MLRGVACVFVSVFVCSEYSVFLETLSNFCFFLAVSNVMYHINITQSNNALCLIGDVLFIAAVCRIATFVVLYIYLIVTCCLVVYPDRV